MQLSAAFRRFPLALLVLASLLALVAVGCGDGNSTIASTAFPSVSPSPSPSPSPTPPPAAPGLAQVRLGDAPADQILDFEVTIVNPMQATLKSGETVTAIIPVANRIDLSHMAGKFEPLLTLSLPQGTYTGAQITIADPAVTYVYTPLRKTDAPGGILGPPQPQLVSQDFPGNQTINLTFDPPLVIGADPSVLSIDVNIAGALVFNPNDSQEITNVTFTPATFSLVQKAIGVPEKQQHQDGELECVVGTVVAVKGNTFLVSAGQSGTQLSIATTGTTIFHDSIIGMADLLGRVIEVEGYTASDGSLVANEIELVSPTTGGSIQGVILDAGTSVSEFNPLAYPHQADSFTILGQDGTGNGATFGDVGWTFTVHTQYMTNLAYEIDAGKTDVLGLKIPNEVFPFDAQHLFAGQRVEVSTAAALPGADFTDFTATGVELEQQAVTGEILFYHTPQAVDTAGSIAPPVDMDNLTWFILALPPDSFVSALSGRHLIVVFQGAGTDMEFLSTNTDQIIGEGSLVRVRGLLFMPSHPPDLVSATANSLAPKSPILTMISRRITELQKPEPPPVPGLAK